MSFNNLIKNKLFMTLLVIYILIATLLFYYNSAEWMQVNGEYVASLDNHTKTIDMLDRLLDEGNISREAYDIAKQKALREMDVSFHMNNSWNEYLEEEKETVKGFGNKAWNIFLQYKIFFYILFGFIAIITLLFAWLRNPLPTSSKIDAIPNEYFKDFFILILGFSGALLLLTLSIYYFTTHSILNLLVNLISLLIIGFEIGFLFKRGRENISILILGIIGAIIGYTTSGWWLSFLTTLIGGILGGYLFYDAKTPQRNFIISLLRLIPCFFINLANKIAEQFKITNKKTWVYLLIELALIGLKFLIPFIYKLVGKLFMPKHNTLLIEPVSLHHLTNLGIFESKKQERDNNFAEKSFMNYNYALSFWIWIIPEPSSTSLAYNKSTSILNLSDVVKINFNKQKIEILAASTESLPKDQDTGHLGAKGNMIKVYEEENIKYQRWNNFIINYNGSTLDIFINGELVSSTPNITPVVNIQGATAGEENGIYGGIKNVVYYLNPLSKREINIISKL